MEMIVVFFVWLLLIAVGVPLYVSFGAASVLYMVTNDLQPLMIAQKTTMAANSFPLLAAPFFILMGNIMNTSGVTRRIFDFATVLVGWIRGGLGHANVLASMIFAGMSGAAVADAGGLGTIEIKAMREAGYDDDFSCAITAASATIGPIVPPSLPMIIYGVVASTSIGGLFVGGIIPGVLMAVALMVMVFMKARIRRYPKTDFPTLGDLWRSFRRAFWAILAPVILLVGIVSGVFTPTEAAVVAAAYALVLGLVVYREFSLRDLPEQILRTIETSGVVLALVMTAVLFGWNLSMAQVPQQLGQLIARMGAEPIHFLLIVNAFLLFVGCFIEAIAAMLILIPILLPVAVSLGIDTIQFGIIMILNLMIGTITPPMGVVLGVTSNVADVPFERVTAAVVPFLIPLLLVLLLITMLPPLTTWLPGLLIAK
jgi:tripartite ATP-independent transporter DctM subunit